MEQMCRRVELHQCFWSNRGNRSVAELPQAQGRRAAASAEAAAAAAVEAALRRGAIGCLRVCCWSARLARAELHACTEEAGLKRARLALSVGISGAECGKVRDEPAIWRRPKPRSTGARQAQHQWSGNDRGAGHAAASAVLPAPLRACSRGRRQLTP